MFGESESESPRVPSPWDSLISQSPSPRPFPLSRSPNSAGTTNSLTIDSIPRLVPENDEGNVEYKLQLLNPSPARFARLVTQLKWRLLEGGGQAYYELGVADSGALVGLPRVELEQSLETLEMMAGEIGASVIVVKEIEVPAVMAGIAATQTDTWSGKRRKRAHDDLRKSGSEEGSGSSSAVASWTSTTETESTTDFDPDDAEDPSMTIILDKTTRISYQTTPRADRPISIFSLDPDPDPAGDADAEPDEDISTTLTSFSIDLEISTVFKPRPMRARMHTHIQGHILTQSKSKNKRLKKLKHVTNPDEGQSPLAQHGEHHGKSQNKAINRRQMRDRKREEKRRALLAFASASTTFGSVTEPSPDGHADKSPSSVASVDSSVVPDVQLDENALVPTASEMSALVSGLAGLHVTVEEPEQVATRTEGGSVEEKEEIDDEDDVFPTTAKPPSIGVGLGGENGLKGVDPQTGQKRLIVEALVVRKMSLDEAFLDFEGFALM